MSYQLYIAKINLFCITYTSEVLPDTRPPQANIFKILRPLTEKYMQNPLENSVSVFVLGTILQNFRLRRAWRRGPSTENP